MKLSNGTSDPLSFQVDAVTHDPIIGACLKHGRNLASCEECGSNRERAETRVIGLSIPLDRAEVERLRAAGELRVMCFFCHGNGKKWSRCQAFASCEVCDRADCHACKGTGWQWSEKR